MLRLHKGDCIEVMREMQSESIDMVLCDLPYGTTRCSWDTPIDLDSLWECYHRVAKPDAAIVLFAQTPFDKVLGASNLKELRYEWIWEKPAATGFFNSKRMPLKAHENILVFYRKLPTYNPQMTKGHARKKASRKTIGSKVYGKGEKLAEYDSTERYPRSVQLHSSGTRVNGFHPTQKPVGLMEYLIKTYTNPGEIVLDNCMGSGTTGVAAINQGRGFVGIEKESESFETSASRLNMTEVA